MQPIKGLSLIVAMAVNRVIGRNNDIPWRIPSDSARFRKITTGHPVIMGRKNWHSLPYVFRPLPKRTNIVLTHKMEWEAGGALVVHSVEQSLEVARNAPGADEIFVIGGEDVYRQFLPLVHKAYVTVVFADNVEGDTYFPAFPPGWQRTEQTEIKRWGLDDEYPTSFEVYEQQAQ